MAPLEAGAIVLLGLPCSGKTTIGNGLAAKLRLPHLVCSKILSEALAENRKLEARFAKREYRDAVVIQLMQDRLRQPDCKHGFVLDGFPRSKAQAEALEVMLTGSTYGGVRLVLGLEAPAEVLQQRAAGRLVDEALAFRDQKAMLLDGARLDDDPAFFRERLQITGEEHAAMRAFFGDRWRSIDASGSVGQTLVSAAAACNLAPAFCAGGEQRKAPGATKSKAKKCKESDDTTNMMNDLRASLQSLKKEIDFAHDRQANYEEALRDQQHWRSSDFTSELPSRPSLDLRPSQLSQLDLTQEVREMTARISSQIKDLTSTNKKKSTICQRVCTLLGNKPKAVKQVEKFQKELAEHRRECEEISAQAKRYKAEAQAKCAAKPSPDFKGEGGGGGGAVRRDDRGRDDSPGGGCIGGDGFLTMCDGSLRQVSDLQVGDVVKAGGVGRAEIVCIAYGCSPREMCQVGNLWLAPRQPVFWQGLWRLPEDIAPRVSRVAPHFSLVLDRGHSVFVNGLECASLAREGGGSEPFASLGLGRNWPSKGFPEFLRQQPDFPRVDMDAWAGKYGGKACVREQIERLDFLHLHLC